MSQTIKTNPFLSNLTLMVAVAVLYAATGYIGLYLAPPPGYATAIWVPSGIALGAAIIWGLRTLPSIFVGSLLINFYITHSADPNASLVTALLIGSIIATGATLQTLFGYVIIKKWVGLNNPLTNLHDILLFAILSGPISALVNATWSNTALLLLKILPPNIYLLSWATWWIGDSIGILIFTPVFLILFGKPRIIWHARIFPILFPLLCGFLAVILAYFVVESIELSNIKSSFMNMVNNDLMQLQNRLLSEKIKSASSSTKIDKIINNTFENKNSYYLVNIQNISDPQNLQTIYTFIQSKLKPPTGFFGIEFQNKIEIDEQTWLISAVPSRSYINTRLTWQSWLVLIAGLLFCVFLNIILFIIYGQKYLAQLGMKEKTSALQSAEQKNLQILEAAGEGIYGLDIDGNTTFVNPAATKMLGYSEEELIGKKMHQLIHAKNADGSLYPAKECPVYAAFHEGKVHRISDEVFWRKDGTSFWVDYTSTPLKEGKQITGAVVVFKDISKQREIEFELERMAHFDLLTSLPNRSSFLNHLSIIVDHAKNSNRILAVLFIDIDNFKQINDNLGHNIGDEALIIISKLLRNDLSKIGYFARLGGDEFGVILEYVNSEKEIIDVLERIIEILNKPIKFNNLEIKISISIGVALFPSGGTKAQDLIMNADIAMYHAKESGKGFYAFFDEIISKKAKRKNQIDMELRQALARKEFSLNYQIQMDIKAMKPFGIETLLRWDNKNLGVVSPSEFIPIAEANGLIYEIGEWILYQACKDYKELQTVLKLPLLLSVNISVMQLENPKFLRTITKLLADTQMSCNNLLLEITETGLMRNPEHLLSMMYQIKALGIHFALDDFGISYSSMHYLKNMPVSLIKLDKSFVHDMVTDTSDAKIVHATIQLSQALGINTIAEGVENNKQYDLLKKMGCQYMQGFYFAKPMSLIELLKKLTTIDIL